jgi:alanyl-tRNA synthetase
MSKNRIYTSEQVREKFLSFYESKGHVRLPSSPVVPKEDPTVLFTTAGMQPLVPYLLGQKHPAGTRLVNSQKCIRTVDIEEVGDNRHCTYFEMLGTWSLGDYGKRESIQWGFEFLTSPEYLGLDPKRLFVTVYKGDDKSVEADIEAIEVWKELFEASGVDASVGVEYDFKNNKGTEYIYRITQKSGKDNWWGLPYRGPCGPCSEIYYLSNEHDTENIFDKLKTMDANVAEEFIDSQIVEIWNHVFMEYLGEKTERSEPLNIVPLERKNIDTGMGFERLLAALNGVDTVYKTDLLSPIVDVVDDFNRA